MEEVKLGESAAAYVDFGADPTPRRRGSGSKLAAAAAAASKFSLSSPSPPSTLTSAGRIVHVSCLPGPLGMLLCSACPDAAIVQGFDNLPSGVKGQIEQHGGVLPGSRVVSVNGMTCDQMPLHEVLELLARESTTVRRIGFADGFIQKGGVLEKAIQEHEILSQTNIYIRMPTRTRIFKEWQRYYYIFEVPYAISIYSSKDQHTHTGVEGAKRILFLNRGKFRITELEGPRSYTRARQAPLYLHKFALQQRIGMGGKGRRSAKDGDVVVGIAGSGGGGGGRRKRSSLLGIARGLKRGVGGGSADSYMERFDDDDDARLSASPASSHSRASSPGFGVGSKSRRRRLSQTLSKAGSKVGSSLSVGKWVTLAVFGSLNRSGVDVLRQKIIKAISSEIDADRGAGADSQFLSFQLAATGGDPVDSSGVVSYDNSGSTAIMAGEGADGGGYVPPDETGWMPTTPPPQKDVKSPGVTAFRQAVGDGGVSTDEIGLQMQNDI